MAITHYKLCALEGTEFEVLDDPKSRNLCGQQQTRLERAFGKARAELRQMQEDRRKRQAEAEAQVKIEAKEAEVKQEAKKFVTEALQVVSVLRNAESALKQAGKPPASLRGERTPACRVDT